MVVVNQEGYVRLMDRITLTHVLYVPQLHFNVLSVSQLCDASRYIVQFDSDMCAI